MNWVIRPAVAADAAKLSELAERTFRDAFSSLNTAENMDLHCATAFSPEVQSGEIADPEILTLVAESQGALIAFAQLHLHSVTPGCVSVSPAVELHRIYVEQRFHGTGLARHLMDEIITRAEQKGAAAVWLGVWEHNPRAIRFYQRYGFVEAGDHVFVVGADPQRDLVMVRKLSL
jgi:ribosomal protein S18 acetylase RimI-like enzyme